MKILMLVNWKIKYTDAIPQGVQPPDYYIKGEPYWFFRYFKSKPQVDVIDISSFPWLEKFEKNITRFYVLQTLKALPRLNQYDMVISHGMQSGIVLCLWRRVFGKGKYRHIAFDIGAFNSAKESGKFLKLCQYAGKSLDGVIYHTKAQREYYKKCHPWLLGKAKYIPFGTDVDFFASENLEEFKGKPYILCIGDKKRDWDTLVKSYQLLEDRYRNKIELRIVGHVEKRWEKEKRIKMIPFIPIDHLKEQIQNALFCVLPLQSFNYSYGQMSLLQQMMMGKAVIAANVPSLAAYPLYDDLGETTNLVLYDPGNVENLSIKMREMIEHSGKRHTIEKAAVQSVREKFNEEMMAKKIEEFILWVYEGKHE